MKQTVSTARWSFAAFALLVAASAGCGGVPRESSQAADASAPPLEVRAARAAKTGVTDLHEVGGVVRARTSAALVSRIVAPVREVRVRAGDSVRAGQVLVVLDGRDLVANARRARETVLAAESGRVAAAAERDAARAALELARATHQRFAALHARQSATAQEFDQAVAGLRGAEARVAGAEARLHEADSAIASMQAAGEAADATASYAVITAPFDGLVTEKLVEPGNMAGPGQPLIRIDGRGGFRLEIRVDESRAAYVAPGQRVDVILESAATPLEGSVSEVSRAVDSDARAFLVKIDLPEAAVRAGMFGRARLPGAARSALVVPEAAVVRRGQVTSLFVVEEGRAHLRLVRTGVSTSAGTEVLAGVSEGEWVVTPPPSSLTDGRRVQLTGAGETGSAAPARGERS
jgi:RND family efflux transporter MFP subunit